MDWASLGITLGIFGLLLASAILLGKYFKSKDDKPDDPGWWERGEWGDEPVWPGGGAIPPKKEEPINTDAYIRVSK